MNFGIMILLAVLLVLVAIAFWKGEDFAPILQRLIEQFAKLVPRMLCALIAAGFIAELIPKVLIAGYLGDSAGLIALPVAAFTGLLVPSGPVIAFAIAAVFAKAGASTPALITFITSWTLYAGHRILIYEVPLLGGSFLRLRAVSVLVVPFLAGLMAMAVGMISTFGTATP